MPIYKIIKEGGKYWKRQVLDVKDSRRGEKRTVEYLPVFVLRKNDETKEVLASIAGAPAQWYGKMLSTRWLLNKPDNE